MSDLKKKLLAAVYAGVSLNKLDAVPKDSTNWFRATRNGDVYEFVIDAEHIKQAFTDAGWMDMTQLGGIKSTNIATPGGKRVEFMTGKYWYDRYIIEKGFGSLDNLKDMPPSKGYVEGIDHAVIKCDEAAQRAAGLARGL